MQRLRFVLYEPAELLKAVKAMAETETTKQTFLRKWLYHRRRPRRLVIATGLEEIEIRVADSTDENGARRPKVENSVREPLGPVMTDMIGIR
ncbi:MULTISPECIES: hypothetical protein [Rhizobium]|uniref:hypothetical protein n=1 Tax=Rhizobium TaxID=379 RepID=UPI001FE328D2|nr:MULTISPECIES: hypothetical protein [Rhizobium]